MRHKLTGLIGIFSALLVIGVGAIEGQHQGDKPAGLHVVAEDKGPTAIEP
ncbi:hypothetical protein [Streptomyces sp. NBC_01306]|nr:hypothetical protein [Streptomyces sp. NBC_01306]MCX4725039.1 hypothetical protein [Streptomyces sp. NBC_01306]